MQQQEQHQQQTRAAKLRILLIMNHNLCNNGCSSFKQNIL